MMVHEKILQEAETTTQELERKEECKKRMWVRNWMQRRKKLGGEILFQELKVEIPNVTRMP